MKKFNPNYKMLSDMYEDSYLPDFLVDKIQENILTIIAFLESDQKTTCQIQKKLDEMTNAINNRQEEFGENDSEIETVARDSITTTIEYILQYYNIEIDLETALGQRDW